MEEMINNVATEAQVNPMEEALTQALKERDQYRAAYEAQVQKYNKLFALFANTVDFYLTNGPENR